MNQWLIYAAIGFGGALGACSRYFLAQLALQVFGKGFPFGTLLVNIIGSLLLGMIYSVVEQGVVAIQLWRSLMMVGFLGALTTFSTFSLDTLLLIQQGEWLKGGLNVSLNVTCCLLAAWLGMQLIKGL